MPSSMFNNILFDKADKIVKSSLDTISDSRVGQVSSVEESMVARGVELFEKGLKHRHHYMHISMTKTVYPWNFIDENRNCLLGYINA